MLQVQAILAGVGMMKSAYKWALVLTEYGWHGMGAGASFGSMFSRASNSQADSFAGNRAAWAGSKASKEKW